MWQAFPTEALRHMGGEKQITTTKNIFRVPPESDSSADTGEDTGASACGDGANTGNIRVVSTRSGNIANTYHGFVEKTPSERCIVYFEVVFNADLRPGDGGTGGTRLRVVSPGTGTKGMVRQHGLCMT